jgi:release factor glutamine methyltransferase
MSIRSLRPEPVFKPICSATETLKRLPVADKTPVWTIKAALDWTQGYLATNGAENPRLEAQWLLTAATDLSRLELYTNHDQPLTGEQRRVLREAIKRRVAGEPLQYILGKAPFRHLELRVRPGVLIPRPETEVLVDLVLDELRALGEAAAAHPADPQPEALRVLDLCTGTGCIALSLLHEYPGVQVVATDIDPTALTLAQENATLTEAPLTTLLIDPRHSALPVRHSGLVPESSGRPANDNGCTANNVCAITPTVSPTTTSLTILLDDLATTLVADPATHASFDIVVSNPPYVPTAELAELPNEVAAFEPHAALDGGPDGLHIFRRILKQAQLLLKPNALLACELHETTLEQAKTLCESAGFHNTKIHPDLTHAPRILTTRRTG